MIRNTSKVSAARIWLIIMMACCLCLPIHAQEYTDTTFSTAGKGQEINLNLLWYSINHGEINWQASADGNAWLDISDGNNKNYIFTARSSSFYRARIESGTCDPVYSKITHLRVADIETDSVHDVTGSTARVACRINDTGLVIVEQGLAYDTKPLPDETSSMVVDHTDSSSFTIDLDSLVEGGTYYARVYIRTEDGLFLPGNVLGFTTNKIRFENRLNAASSSVRMFYNLSSTPAPSEHGVFYSTQAGPDTSSAKVTGEFSDGKYSAVIPGLDPATKYYTIPYMIVNGNYILGDQKEVVTFSDYSNDEVDTSAFTIAHKIVWNDPSTAKKISQDGYYAEYGRVTRLGDSDTILLVYHGGPNLGDWVNISLRKSFDNGMTWTDQEIIMNIAHHSANFWRFCNPEIIELENGWILIPYIANGKPETNDNCYVHVLISKDRGATWEGPTEIVTGRSWEPVIVQLPNGELEMLYSSEAKWWPSNMEDRQQEIHSILSTDNGLSWSYPEVAAYYPGKRDGMPVPVLLQGNKGVAFIIETVWHWRSPYIVKRDLAGNWDLPDPIDDYGDTRWAVFGFPGHGGAPYMAQLPTGETVITCHVGRGVDWHQSNMHVMIGDNDAKNFEGLTTPWGNIPIDEGAIMSSIFIKDNNTMVLITSRNQLNGESAIYWLEGTITPK
jgi:hypothetical protein